MSGCVTTVATPIPKSESDARAGLYAGLMSVLAEQPAGQDGIALALSGGLDSTALLHVLARVGHVQGIKIHALHVHHGLSPNADVWLSHCRCQCDALGVSFHHAKVHVAVGSHEGLEAQARRLRYAALSRLAQEAGCTRVLLAHHQDDQAETVLLQALRGAGVAGLAAMPRVAQRGGVLWLRPWLDQPRAVLQAYVHHHGLAHVDDESNLDLRFARNAVRHELHPVLEALCPGASAALSQVALQAQEAMACLDEFAALDLKALTVGQGLDVSAWFSLSAPRRGNVLRAWLKQVLGIAAPRTLVQRLQHELRPGQPPHRWPAPGGSLGVYRDVLQRLPPKSMAAYTVDKRAGAWPVVLEKPGTYVVPGGEGVVDVVPAAAYGAPLNRLVALNWRSRSGGEQFQQHLGGVPRSLKKAYQAAAVPTWQRGVSLLYSGDTLVFVPGLGLDARFLLGQGQGVGLVTLQWRSLAKGLELGPSR